MIQGLTTNNPIPQAADAASKPAASSQTLCHTPFGDVLVDELSTPDLVGLMCQKPASGGAAPAPAQLGAETGAPGATSTTSAPAATATSSTTATPAAETTPVPTSAAPAATNATAVTLATPASGPQTAQSLFGDQPWMQNPGGIGPAGAYAYNPIYFATPQTAATVAKMFGGTVVEKNMMTSVSGPFAQSQPNEMVDLPNGREIYAGIVADFYNHGYSQDWINKLINSEIGATQS